MFNPFKRFAAATEKWVAADATLRECEARAIAATGAMVGTWEYVADRAREEERRAFEEWCRAL
jgi:hypothetical protein